MYKFIFYYILLSYTIIIDPLLINMSLYIPYLVYLYIAPFVLLFFLKRFNSKDKILLLVALLIASTAVTHSSAFRPSTVIFSVMCILGFILYTKVLERSKIPSKKYKAILKFILYSYFYILVIQQICIICHLPVVNGIGYEGFKLNSLTIEPSHMGIILVVVIYSYIKMVEQEHCVNKISLKAFLKMKESHPFLAGSYILLFCGSVTCILSFLVLMLYFINKRYIIICSGLFILLILLIFSFDFAVITRIKTLIPAFFTFDPSIIYEVDPSSSARITPYLFYIRDFNLVDINTWIGHGCDYATVYLVTELTGGYEGYSLGVGGFINFMFDYGLLPASLFLIYIKQLVGFKSFPFFIYIVLISSVPFNTYLLWIFMIFIYTNIYFYNKTSCYEIPHPTKNIISCD